MVVRTRVSAAIAAIFICAQGAQAQEAASSPPAFKDFTFKRVKPPESGTKKRITVQIAPRANPAVAPPLASAPSPKPAPQAGVVTGAIAGAPAVPLGSYAWFWNTVSPEVTATGPGRLTPALATLTKGPEGQSVGAPRLQGLQEIAQAHGVDLLRETVGTRVSPALALAVIAVESAGESRAKSKAGAQGLMQLMPATAERFGVKDAFDATQNIRGGVAFLDFLMEKFEGDPILVLAGYNAGENSIGKHSGVPPYAETRDYVPKVLAAFSVARGLCLTPPELISDGCVFRVMSP
ncbi:lytic transglycosylase domain-containing protein [Antarctobacter sp.]|uniref:lytic transglycosylase domain-containing protein n=1 Tax=Antarctobacter sp. TaxID=1872577 RepID=UPI002B26811B|nr:transglycosylase SLT domain-containing protein [Antarctobacter sp.]